MALKELGFIRLPESLEEALARVDRTKLLHSWFSNSFLEVYIAHKKSEIDHVKDLGEAATCALYERTY